MTEGYETDRLVFVDIETTGLDPAEDLILEVGIVVVNLDLEEIDSIEVQIWEDAQYDSVWKALAATSFPVRTHTENGLLEACLGDEALSIADADKALVDFLVTNQCENEPMCGSSVGFDRSFLSEYLPATHDLFHYRNIDISSLKELCKRYNPDLFERMGEQTVQQKFHRAIPDIEDSINEFRFYRDEFLLWQS